MPWCFDNSPPMLSIPQAKLFKTSVKEIHFSASFAICFRSKLFCSIIPPADLPQMGSELGCAVRECTGHSGPGTVKVGAVKAAVH